jgi:hypothetical protein
VRFLQSLSVQYAVLAPEMHQAASSTARFSMPCLLFPFAGANVLSVDGPHEVDMDAQRSDLQLKVCVGLPHVNLNRALY